MGRGGGVRWPDEHHFMREVDVAAGVNERLSSPECSLHENSRTSHQAAAVAWSGLFSIISSPTFLMCLVKLAQPTGYKPVTGNIVLTYG